MSFENVFPFLKEEREREIKKELDLLRGLLAVMERDEKKVSGNEYISKNEPQIWGRRYMFSCFHVP